MRLVVLVACCAVLLTACGGARKSASAALAQGLRFSECMRAHGVTNFPDPTSSGGGIQLPAGSATSSPAFQAAMKACSKDQPGVAGLGQATREQKQRMLAISRCMRAHGLADFPDPVSTPPQPGTGFGLAFGRPGSFIAIPQSMLNSPAFNQAASACGLPGAGRLGPGKPGARKSFPNSG